MKNRNFLILWIRDALIAASSALTSSSVLSGHLLHIGMSGDKISFYLAFVPLVNLGVSLAFSGITSKTKKTIPAYSALCLASAALTSLYALIFSFDIGIGAVFSLIMAAGCLLTAATAVRTIFDYKLPCEVIELTSYSVYVSVGGIVSGVFGILAGAALTFGYNRFDFGRVTVTSFVSAGLLLAAASFINGRLKRIDTVPGNNKNKNAGGAGLRELFKDRSFRALIIPNLIRGTGMAAVSMITVIGVDSAVITDADGAAVTVCTYAATLAGCLFYAFFARRVDPGKLCIFGALVFCLIVPSLSGGKAVFFICYTLSYAGYYIVSCAIPDTVYRNVDKEMMSIFHTWRLAFSTVGTTVSTALIGKLIGAVPAWTVLAAAVATHLITSASYYAVFKRSRKSVGREVKG